MWLGNHGDGIIVIKFHQRYSTYTHAAMKGDSTNSAIEDLLKRLIFPERNTTVITCSDQHILRLIDIPMNAGRMPDHCQVANATFRVPYSHSFIIGSADNPLTVGRKERK